MMASEKLPDISQSGWTDILWTVNIPCKHLSVPGSIDKIIPDRKKTCKIMKIKINI